MKISNAFGDIIRERLRQVSEEGWSVQHDDAHQQGILAQAAACYAAYASGFAAGGYGKAPYWPFDAEWFKPKTPRRDLIRAAALIVAEIERLDRETAARVEAPTLLDSTSDGSRAMTDHSECEHKVWKCVGDHGVVCADCGHIISDGRRPEVILAEDNAALRTENAGLRKDAERYRDALKWAKGELESFAEHEQCDSDTRIIDAALMPSSADKPQFTDGHGNDITHLVQP